MCADRGPDLALTPESPAPAPGDGAARSNSPGLARTGVQTYVYSALVLAANLLSGVVSARALGPSGRGVIVSLVALTQLLGFLLAMGAAQSLSYFIARVPKNGPILFTTWLVMLVPCCILAIVIGELLLTSVFAVHNAEAIATGRWFLFTVVLVIGLELNSGLLLGVHDFAYYNALRLAQPAMMAVSFAVLWGLGSLTITSALIAPTAATAIVLALGMARSARRIGVGRLDVRLGLTTLWYGTRGQGVLVATHINGRLDVAMLPAFVIASSVGLYSVATNVSLIIYQLSNTFAALLVPVAARDPERGPAKVLSSLWASLAIAGILALGVALLAKPLLGLVYGTDFRHAAFTLRLLLPGAVLFAGSSILTAGIYAAGRPFLASLGQLLGMVVTVVGLLVFLRSGGITAAALVSSASYSTVFVATLIIYKLVSGMPWRWFAGSLARVSVS